LSDQRDKQLLEGLLDPNCAVLTEDQTGEKPNVTANESKDLAEESGAGPATQELLRQLGASGAKVTDPEDLIPLIKELAEKKEASPKKCFKSTRKSCWCGSKST